MMPKTRAILQLVSTPLLYLFDLNTAAFIKFLAFLMRRLFEAGVNFENHFLKSLTTVIVNRL